MKTYGYEGGDLLSILDQLNTHTLADGGIWLLGLNTDFLKDNPFGMRGSSSRGCLVDVAQGTLFVCFIGLEGSPP